MGLRWPSVTEPVCHDASGEAGIVEHCCGGLPEAVLGDVVQELADLSWCPHYDRGREFSGVLPPRHPILGPHQGVWVVGRTPVLCGGVDGDPLSTDGVVEGFAQGGPDALLTSDREGPSRFCCVIIRVSRRPIVAWPIEQRWALRASGTGAAEQRVAGLRVAKLCGQVAC